MDAICARPSTACSAQGARVGRRRRRVDGSGDPRGARRAAGGGGGRAPGEPRRVRRPQRRARPCRDAVRDRGRRRRPPRPRRARRHAGAARRRSPARVRLRHDALLRRVGGRAALPRLRRLPAAVPAHDRALRADAPRGDRGHRRLRPGLRDLRGLGAVAERPRPRVARPARRRGDARVPAPRRRRRSWPRTGGATAATTPPCGASTRRSTPAPASWRARAAWGRSSARCYRWFWGARPVPARLEAFVHRRLFARSG